MPTEDCRASPGSEKAARRRRESARTPSPRPHRDYYYYKSYDEGLEFPCLMSHWRTWSTFTTFSAQIGITIQGFSVT